MTEPALGWALLAAVVLWRLVELVLARRNLHALLAAGARRHDDDATLLLVVLHVLTLSGIVLERLLGARLGGGVSWAAGAVLVVALALRVWTLGTLGRRWTIAVVTQPEEAPVRRGPYRFLRHPNYLVVLLEVIAVPLLFHAWWTFGLLIVPHVLALRLRIRREEAAWQGRLAA